MQFVFIVCPSGGLPKYFTKKGLELVFLAHFLHDF